MTYARRGTGCQAKSGPVDVRSILDFTTTNSEVVSVVGTSIEGKSSGLATIQILFMKKKYRTAAHDPSLVTQVVNVSDVDCVTVEDLIITVENSS